MNTDDTAAAFGNMLADPKQMAFWMIVTVVLGFLVCSRGLQNGLEKISKFMMSALLLLIIVLAVHSITLSGALEGVKFYLVPNLDAVSEIGVFYAESGCGRNGDIRQLYGKGLHSCR